MPPFDALIRRERSNAALGWVLVGVVALAAVQGVRTGAVLWAGVAVLAGLLIALPAVWTRRWTAMVPWPVVALVAIATVVGSFGMYVEIAGYVVVATIALVVVAEFDVFTPVEMSRRFAVGFTVLTTLAFQGLWIVAQFYSDRFVGTDFITTQVELQWDIVAVTVVAIILGGFFAWYSARFSSPGASDRSRHSGGLP